MQTAFNAADTNHRAAFARPDGRSREARFRKALRSVLLDGIGGNPTSAQSVLIGLAVDAAVHLEMLKRHDGADLSARDRRIALDWQHSYRRLLEQLGLTAP